MTQDDRQKILSALESRVRPELFRTWCQDLSFIEMDDRTVVVPAPNGFYRDALERDLRRPLEEAFASIFGKTPRLVFEVRDGGGDLENILEIVAPSPATPKPRTVEAGHPLFLNPSFTFDSFVWGPTNRLAYATAVAVSESPGRDHNPLFIHGGVGLGKTHLLQAVCQATRERNPHARILFTSCEGFVNDYISSMQKKLFESFRARYRGADLLVIDDVHFLAGKESSQEEFFHTFNSLHGTQRQVVLSSDSSPRDIRALSERLISRFISGCVARIDPPTYEMRLAIVQKKAETRGFELPADVAGYVASRVHSNVRELDGAITKLQAFKTFMSREVSVALAQEVLEDLPASTRPDLTPAQILEMTARHFGKRVTELTARQWSKSTSRARQVAMYLCKKLTPLSLAEIGTHFDKDHTTVLYAVRKVERLLISDKTVRNSVEVLSDQLGVSCN